MVNVGQFISPMDPIGFLRGLWGFQTGLIVWVYKSGISRRMRPYQQQADERKDRPSGRVGDLFHAIFTPVYLKVKIDGLPIPKLKVG